MKRFFHSELDAFRSNIVLMGGKAIELSRQALIALVEQDGELARAVIDQDDDIDELEKLVDGEAIRYISLRSPVGSELRLLAVGMKCGNDLERVGDEASSIAKRARELSTALPVGNFLGIPAMAEMVLGMLDNAMNAFFDGDEEAARAIVERDKQVDRLNSRNYKDFSAQMQGEPERICELMALVMVSKSLERIGDHAVNIAQEVIYLRRGEDVRHSDEIKRIKREAARAAEDLLRERERRRLQIENGATTATQDPFPPFG